MVGAATLAVATSISAASPAKSTGHGPEEHRPDGGRSRPVQDARDARQAGRPRRRRCPAPATLTVFAPTDAAFAKVPKATLAAARGREPAQLKARPALPRRRRARSRPRQVVKLTSAKTLDGADADDQGQRHGKVYVERRPGRRRLT